MKNIVDIFQSALGLDGIKAGVSHLLQSFTYFFWSDDNTSCCMCCCCDDGCC